MSRSRFRDLFFMLNMYREQKKLSLKSLAVMNVYICHHGPQGAWPSLTRIQQQADLSRTAVSNAKKELAKYPELIEFYPQALNKPDLALIPLLIDTVVVPDYQESAHTGDSSQKLLVVQKGEGGSPRLPEIGLEISKNQEDYKHLPQEDGSIGLPDTGDFIGTVIPIELLRKHSIRALAAEWVKTHNIEKVTRQMNAIKKEG